MNKRLNLFTNDIDDFVLGEDTPRMLAADGSMLPSPRTISNLVHRASAQTKFERGLTTMVMQWGQFTDHDIVITPTVKGKFMCEKGGFHLFL